MTESRMIVKAIVSILQRFLRGCVIYNDWHYIYVLVCIYIYIVNWRNNRSLHDVYEFWNIWFIHDRIHWTRSDLHPRFFFSPHYRVHRTNEWNLWWFINSTRRRGTRKYILTSLFTTKFCYECTNESGYSIDRKYVTRRSSQCIR